MADGKSQSGGYWVGLVEADKHPSMMHLWLEKAGVFTNRWQVSEARFREIIGPLLEQLAARAVNAALADLAGQEFIALLLQVLPQALPPQHVQAALSPQAINGYQAIAKYLHRTGAATHGDELVEAVKLVRQQLTAQVRQAGILNGPDYSDPDEKKPAQ